MTIDYINADYNNDKELKQFFEEIIVKKEVLNNVDFNESL